MKRVFNIFAAVLLLGGLLAVIPTVSAAAPTLDWTIQFGTGTTTAAAQHPLMDVNPATSSVVLGYYNVATPTSYTIYVYDVTGAVQWSVTGDGTLLDVIWDRAGRVVFTVSPTTGSDYLYRLNGETGAVEGSLALSTLSPSFDPGGLLLMSSYTPAEGEANILLTSSGQNRVALLDEDLAAVWNIGVTAPQDINIERRDGAAIPTHFYMAAGSPSITCQKRLLTTGAQVGSSLACGSTTLSPVGNAPMLGQNDATKVFHAVSSGTGASTELSYDQIAEAAWTLDLTAQDFTPNQVQDPGSVDTGIWDFDIDGADSLLLCGATSTGKNYIAKGETVTDTIEWQVLATVVGTTAADSYCTLDYQGGLYFAFERGNAPGARVVLQHYTGGDFSGKFQHETTNAPEEAVAIPIETDIAEGTKTYFESMCGTSAGALFFCGLILITIFMVAVAAGIGAFTSGRAAGIAAGVVGIGGAIFNIFIELWEVWAGVVLIVLSAGVILGFVKALQFSRGGEA